MDRWKLTYLGVCVMCSIIFFVEIQTGTIQQLMPISLPSRGLPQKQLFEEEDYRNSTTAFVCMSFYGRLGNQMFQYASMYGISRMKHMDVLVGHQDMVSQLFNISAKMTKTKRYCNFKNQKTERFSCSYDKEILDFNETHNTKLSLYLQSWKYFINFTKEVRKEFAFKGEIMKRAQSVFFAAVKNMKNTSKDATYIGIHIRRGDMIKERKVAPVEYVLNAITYYRIKFSKTIFIACSDDIKWVEDTYSKYSSEFNIAFIKENSAEVDLAVLGLCNHTIITVGTFGWWAGWLAGGLTIYYKDFIPETEIGARYRKNFNGTFTNYFMSNWIGL